MTSITRFGISMDAGLLKRFDAFMKQHGYENRSEAFRGLVRDRLVQEEWKDDGRETVGTITLIYNHHQRDLSEKLISLQHEGHEIVLSAMHVHLDHHNCLEVLAVKGSAAGIRKMADRLIGTRGVKHGKLVMTSTGKDL